MKKTGSSRADNVGWFLIKVARPDLAPLVAAQVDGLFQNSLAETLTETEQAFALGFVSMTEAILLAIQWCPGWSSALSWWCWPTLWP